MADTIYKVRDPDGNIREIKGPEGASDDEVIAQAQSLFAKKEIAKEPTPELTPTQSAISDALRFALHGPVGIAVGVMNRSINAGNDKLSKFGYDVGGKVTDATGSPALGTAANVAVQAAPSIAFGKLASMASAPMLDTTARWLMRSAIKPTGEDLLNGTAERAVGTMLENGLNVSKGGMVEARRRATELSKEAAGLVEKASGDVVVGNVKPRLFDSYRRFKNDSNPEANLQKMRDEWQAFQDHPLIGGEPTIPVQVANQIKQGTQDSLRRARAFGELGSAEEAAKKGIASGLRQEVERVVPEVGPVNKKASDFYNVLDVSERRALMELNKNPMGIALIAKNPAMLAAFMMDRSAMFKSIVARMLFSGQERIPQAVASGFPYLSERLDQIYRPQQNGLLNTQE